jgi:glycosyltransferase involved in cell wall biosynthesis
VKHSNESGRILVIVPAYNEAASIGRVIEDIAAAGPDWDILVVNDCSRDGTGESASIGRAAVINLCHNLGIGGAVQTGFRYARDNGYAAAVQVDGDGQHSAAGIPLLLNGLYHGNADVVIGSRFRVGADGYKSTALRRAGIAVIGAALNLLTGYGIRDVTSGFRAYGRAAIELVAREYPSDFPEPESLILFRQAGFTVKEIAVSMLPRRTGRSSIRGITPVYYVTKVLLALLIRALRSRS